MIDFASQSIEYLFNPSLSPREKALLAQAKWPDLKAHIWLASSGTTTLNELKVCALSKKSFLHSAEIVNKHIDSNSQDIWFKSLPSFHVGGLSILARAYLSGAQVIEEKSKWNAQNLVSLLKKNKVTLLSLVPTQVYGLVQNGLSPNSELRLVFVGGGALSFSLYLKARELGWPLLPTYGMSEVASQVATASVESLHVDNKKMPEAPILPHIKARILLDDGTRVDEGEGILEISSESLLTVEGRMSEKDFQFFDPKKQGWYETQDRVVLKGNILDFISRKDELKKVGAELVNIFKLRHIWAEMSFSSQSLLTFEKEDRLDFRVVLVSEEKDFRIIEEQVHEFNESVSPFERVRGLYFVQKLPRTELGKIRIKEVDQYIEY